MADKRFETCPACGQHSLEHVLKWNQIRALVEAQCIRCGCEWSDWPLQSKWDMCPRPLVVSVTEAARCCGVTRGTILRWIKQRKLYRAYDVVKGEHEPMLWWAEVEKLAKAHWAKDVG